MNKVDAEVRAVTGEGPVISLLLRQLDQAFDVRSWHGTNLMGSLRGMTAKRAVWRPQPGRHNVAELAVHAAYWKYRAARLLSDAAPRTFDLPGSDFFERDDSLTESAWREDVARLKRWHGALRNVIGSLEEGELDVRVSGGRFTRAELICGAAAHDLYHAGQIQLIKRLREGRGR